MKSIGEKIKVYRTKNNMTQEQLAMRLNVTFQTVSKWETGVSSPDLSLIVPLTKIFQISADELLGINDAEADKRYEELKNEYDYSYKTNDFAKRQMICETAVSEYPGDMEWLSNLAWVISNRSFEFEDNDRYAAEQEKAIKLFDSVIKNCGDEYIKGNAILGITQLLGWRGRKEEGKKYVALLPKRSVIIRDTVLENVLEGDELIRFKQQRIMSNLEGVLWDLSLLPEVHTETICDILAVMFPDENCIRFNLNLYETVKRKINRILRNNPESDIEAIRDLLEELKGHAKEYDRVAFLKPGVYRYTAPWFDHVEEDTREWNGSKGTTLMQDFKEYLLSPQFDGVRDCGFFETLSND